MESGALRFRRWSRKAYAAFVSIQRTVTIGQLSANVANRILAKNDSLHASVSSIVKRIAGEGQNLRQAAEEPEEVLAQLQALLWAKSIPCLLPCRQEAAAHSTQTYSIQIRKGGSSSFRGGGFRLSL